MDINMQEIFFKRLNNAVHSLGTALSYTQLEEDHREVLTLAKMRRVSLCFIAFMHYAAERSGMSKRECELLTYDEIVEILFQRGSIAAADRENVEELLAMHMDLISYDPDISIDEEELEEHIPHVHAFLTNYIARESVTTQRSIVQEITF